MSGRRLEKEVVEADSGPHDKVCKEEEAGGQSSHRRRPWGKRSEE